eukprot:450075-Pleurochrysis_carterae.AAC.9
MACRACACLALHATVSYQPETTFPPVDCALCMQPATDLTTHHCEELSEVVHGFLPSIHEHRDGGTYMTDKGF